MKKLLYLFFVISLFFACTEDEPEQTQDYTSYIISNSIFDNLSNVKTGYYNQDGECILIHEHGDLKSGTNTEEFIMLEFHNEIYLFFGEHGATGMRLEKPFIAQKNKKNKFIIPEDVRGVFIEERNHNNWPH